MLDDPKAFGEGLRKRVEDLVSKAVDAAMAKWIEQVPEFIKRATGDEVEVRMRDFRSDIEVEKRLGAKWRQDVDAILKRHPDPAKMETLLTEVETATDRFDKRRSELATEIASIRKAEESLEVTAKDLQKALEHAEWLLGEMTKGLREAGTELEQAAQKAAETALEEHVAAAKADIQNATDLMRQKVSKALEDDGERIPFRGFLGPYSKGMKARRGDVAVWRGAAYIASRPTEEPPGKLGRDAPWRLAVPA